jgi:hypothetical protein
LDYFDRQYNHIPVDRMLVSAPAELGLAQALSDSLGQRVEALDISQGMDIVGIPELADSEYASYALHALGAALRLEKKAL